MNKTLDLVVTGASGYIGRNFCDTAISKFYKCTPLGRSTQPNYETFTADSIQEGTSILHFGGLSEDSDKIPMEAYVEANIILTKRMWELFVTSKARNFIFLSSIKAFTEKTEESLDKKNQSNDSFSHYGHSKREAEKYLLKSFQELSDEDRKSRNLYILRPCLVYGSNSKGNLKVLFKLANKGIPYPFAAFENQKSFCSLNNLMEVIFQIIAKDTYGNSKVFSVCDDDSVSTNKLIEIAADAVGKKARLIRFPQFIVKQMAALGTLLGLPFNKFVLDKLTSSLQVSNKELLDYLDWDNMPFQTSLELKKAFVQLKEDHINSPSFTGN